MANNCIELTGECSSGLLTYQPASSYRRWPPKGGGQRPGRGAHANKAFSYPTPGQQTDRAVAKRVLLILGVIKIMKKIYRIVLLLLLLTGLSSCLVKVQYYEHEPTHSFKGIGNRMKSSSFKKLLDFTDNGIVFVPEFSEMTPSYLPVATRSGLIFYSQTKTSIYIEKAILYSESRTYKKELVVNKEVQINEKFKSFYDGSVYLFGDDVTGLDKIWSEDSAILEVYYQIPEKSDNTQMEKMDFKLELKTSSEIPWST